MIIVNTGSINSIIYYTRYEEINKYEIFNHSTQDTFSDETTIIGYGGKINHSGLTYDFTEDTLYTYRSFFVDDNVSYLANQSLITTIKNDDRLDTFKKISKPKNTFKKIIK